jgi:threonine dehydrogenase-like Zn-dependent dehydrogenase
MLVRARAQAVNTQTKDGYKVLIVGGGSAGITTASHYARKIPGQVAVVEPSGDHKEICQCHAGHQTVNSEFPRKTVLVSATVMLDCQGIKCGFALHLPGVMSVMQFSSCVLADCSSSTGSRSGQQHLRSGIPPVPEMRGSARTLNRLTLESKTFAAPAAAAAAAAATLSLPQPHTSTR